MDHIYCIKRAKEPKAQSQPNNGYERIRDWSLVGNHTLEAQIHHPSSRTFTKEDLKRKLESKPMKPRNILEDLREPGNYASWKGLAKGIKDVTWACRRWDIRYDMR